MINKTSCDLITDVLYPGAERYSVQVTPGRWPVDLRSLIISRMADLKVKPADLPRRAALLSEGRYLVSKERISQLTDPYPKRPLTRLLTRETLLALAAALETPVEVVSLAALKTIKAIPWDAQIGTAVTECGDLVLVLARDGCTADEADARARAAAKTVDRTARRQAARQPATTDQ